MDRVNLSFPARFAELHGGRAWVEERPGGGSSDPGSARLLEGVAALAPRIRSVTVDCHDPDGLADFWAATGYVLVALGAQKSQEHTSPSGKAWTVMLDPEGNECCLQ